jgi:drug/metabolite transporter (DMT)-like permease
LSYAEPTLLAPFVYTFVLVGSMMDWALWDRIPSFWTCIGMIFIIAGGVLTILWSKTKEPVKEI